MARFLISFQVQPGSWGLGSWLKMNRRPLRNTGRGQPALMYALALLASVATKDFTKPAKSTCRFAGCREISYLRNSGNAKKLGTFAVRLPYFSRFRR